MVEIFSEIRMKSFVLFVTLLVAANALPMQFIDSNAFAGLQNMKFLNPDVFVNQLVEGIMKANAEKAAAVSEEIVPYAAPKAVSEGWKLIKTHNCVKSRN